MRRTMRMFAISIAGTLAGCAGGKSTPAPAEKQVTEEARTPAPRSGTPPVLTIEADRLLLDGAELVKVADLPPGFETIGALADALAKNVDAGELVLRADKDAPALLINAILRTARAAGYATISLCSRSGDANETCPRLVLSDQGSRP